MKLKRLGIFVIVFLVTIMGIDVTGLYAHGQTGLITSLTVNKQEIQQGDYFSVSVKFGGPGTRVSPNQKEEITITSTENIKVSMTGNGTIPLKDPKTGKVLGDVTFSGDKAVMTFNEFASTLDDVHGAFTFNVNGFWNKDLSEPGRGTIYIDYNGGRATVDFVNGTSGDFTHSIYNKQGVWNTVVKEGNCVDWLFTVNGAHRPTPGEVVFKIKDSLPDTMNWNVEHNDTKPFAVQIMGNWYTLAQAKAMGLKVDFAGKDLSIEVPTYIMLNGEWQKALDGQEIVFRLTAKITDEVMLDKSIQYVYNQSTAEVTGADWNIDPAQTKASVEIIRSGGWATGVRPGELKVTKKLQGTEKTIQGVVFSLERKDGGDVFVYEGGASVNKGKVLNLTTDDKGVIHIKGLKVGEYILKEVSAPKWIKLDGTNQKNYDFEIKADDTEGTAITVKNQKKTVNVSVRKDWKNFDNSPLAAPVNVSVQLYRNGEAFMDAVNLTPEKLQHTWENLPLADDDGNNYAYTVKEVGTKGNRILLGGKGYTVSVGGDAEHGFVITNKQDRPWTPLIPAKTSVEVSKVWQNSDGTVLGNPTVNTIEVELYKDGVATGNKLTLSKDTGWKGKFTDLASRETITSAPYVYTVKEVGADGNRIKLGGKGYTVSVAGDAEHGFVITNKERMPWTPLVPPTIIAYDVKVNKVATDDNNNLVDVVGAKIQIFEGENAEGRLIDQWVTENGVSHVVKNLKVSGKYTFREESAPKGLKRVSDFVFTVDKDGNVKILSAVTNGKAEFADSKLVVTDDKEPPETPKKPDTPKKPETPKTPTEPTKPGKAPATGDRGGYMMYGLILLASAGLLTNILRKRLQKR